MSEVQVFAVFGSVDWEGSELLGVFTRRDAAEAARAYWAACGRIFDRVTVDEIVAKPTFEVSA